MAKRISGAVEWLNFQDEVAKTLLEGGKQRKYTTFEDAIKIFDESEADIHYIYTGPHSWFHAMYNSAKQNREHN